ncbi:MAG: hypothetical protein JW950_13855 [Deltaproteobacteria bacterium]|nr:hypothetical protein [Deltaproteobacteria bacterium]
MDPRIPRMWFFSTYFAVENWSSEFQKPADRYRAIQTRATQDIHSCSVAKIFLVRAPLTFGHSQLVMDFSDGKEPDEAKRFQAAAPIITKVLYVFQHVLNSDAIRRMPQFAKLAKLTLTPPQRCCYLKTLILRASADEKANQYKVHLVPYFQSHEFACQKRYTAIHSVDPDEKGGLLGWVGERETEVDRWQVNTHPSAFILDKIANDELKMPELAKVLCEAWPSQV